MARRAQHLRGPPPLSARGWVQGVHARVARTAVPHGLCHPHLLEVDLYPGEQHAQPAVGLLVRVAPDKPVQRPLGAREHPPRVVLALFLAADDKICELVNVHARGQRRGHERATRRSREGKVPHSLLHLSRWTLAEQLLLQAARHAQVVGVQPAGRVEAERNASRRFKRHWLRVLVQLLEEGLHLRQLSASCPHPLVHTTSISISCEFRGQGQGWGTPFFFNTALQHGRARPRAVGGLATVTNISNYEVWPPSLSTTTQGALSWFACRA
eukprot:scaffold18666_cov116-Isochrysis_galbana.AAC.4